MRLLQRIPVAAQSGAILSPFFASSHSLPWPSFSSCPVSESCLTAKCLDATVMRATNEAEVGMGDQEGNGDCFNR